MNKFLSGLILITVLFASCKKDASNIPSVKVKTQDVITHKVTFNVGFSQEAAAFKPNGAKKVTDAVDNAIDPSFDANPQITVLIYTIYDSAGNGVHQITQTKGVDAGFGSYVDNLSAGTYTVAVAAGQTSTRVSSSDGSNKLSTDGIRTSGNSGDLLFKKFTLTVGGSDIVQSVALDRVTGALQVTIKDALPTNAYYLNVSGLKAFLVFSVGTATPVSSGLITGRVLIPVAARGTSNYQATIGYFMPVSGSFQIRLFCTTSTGNVLGEKLITISGQANKVTALSGNLFGGAGGGITTSINTDWTTSTISF